ncbi:MAG: IS1634 family transposase [Pseudomonadota bacterium]|nr:IS1634 family transposase [Pseudomonadota bacterium]
MSRERTSRVEKPVPEARRARLVAQAAGHTLQSHSVGALPLINDILQRLQLREHLQEFLPAEDRRVVCPAATGLIVLLKNVLLSREPLYGVADWGIRQTPHLLGLTPRQIQGFNDDRMGRCLDRLFDADCGAVALRVAAAAVRAFQVSLDELHNDSTTVTFHGAYPDAQEEQVVRGRRTPAITWGHNKDHRPDLKQVLYILTVTADGAVPVQFRVESGNTTDDQTHQTTWDLLCQLSGRRDFLYVADSKLATRENMAYIHQRGGRFLTVLPRTRSEDEKFRQALVGDKVKWQFLWNKTDEDGEVLDRFAVCDTGHVSSEGYRVIWYHSSLKAQRDAMARGAQLERAFSELAGLRQKLMSPRTRYRTVSRVWEAIEQILSERGVKHLIQVQVGSHEDENYRQATRGRPTAKTKYIRQVKTRFDLSYAVDQAALDLDRRGDGVFPLITNVLDATERDLLWAYKKQPTIEKRFSQMKTDFSVAPVHLHSASRIVSFLCVYFLALLVEALLERELRKAMQASRVKTLPLYPEGRPCRYPTAPRVFDAFENVQRHSLELAGQPPNVLITELSPVQNAILKLLRHPSENYGR